MTVLDISQDTLIQLPDGANGGAVTVTYHGTTTGPVIGSGDDQGRAVIVSGRLAKLTNLAKNSPLKVVGREAGGRMPARVTLRVYPEYPAGKSGPVAPITLSGLPVGAPDAPGIWDLGNIDDASGGLDVVTPGERQNLAVLRERTAGAAGQAEAGATRVVDTIAQLSQQQQGNNAQAAMNIGRRTALKVALIGSATGLYNIISGQDAGQVWERKEDGSVTRQPQLEAASAAQLQGVSDALSVPDIATLVAQPYAAARVWVGGVQGAGDAFDLLPVDDTTPSNGGSVIAVTGGRKRKRRAPRVLTPTDYGADPTGVKDSTGAWRAIAANEPEIGALPGAQYRITDQVDFPYPVSVVASGIRYRELRNGNADAQARAAQTASMIIMDAEGFSSEEGWFNFNANSSSMRGFEFAYQRNAAFAAGWAPKNSGVAIRAANRWQQFTDLTFRGMRGGILGVGNAGGLYVHNVQSGAYDFGLQVKVADDVVNVGLFHQSIFSSGFERYAIEYMLAHHNTIILEKCDNPRIESLFTIFARAGLRIVGPTAKASFGRIEVDESLNGVEIVGAADLYGETLVFQRYPFSAEEQANGTYANAVAPLALGAGRVISTTGGASGRVSIGTIDVRRAHAQGLVMDGDLDVYIGAIPRPEWGLSDAGAPLIHAGANVRVSLGTMPSIPGRTLGDKLISCRATGSAALGSITLAAGATADRTVPCPGSYTGMAGSVSTTAFLPVGVTTQAWAANGGVNFRIANPTAAEVTIPALTWYAGAIG